MNDKVKKTIALVLREKFDNCKQKIRLIQYTEAMRPINHESFLEMISDLEAEGIEHNIKY
jgi:hypothetical protein